MSLSKAFFLKHHNSLVNSHKHPSILRRTLTTTTTTSSSSSDKFQHPTKPIDENKRSLSDVFQEAVGLSEKTETTDTQNAANENGGGSELKKKLWELEAEVRGLREAKSKNFMKAGTLEGKKAKQTERPKSLYALFSVNGKGNEKKAKSFIHQEEEEEKKVEFFKELSPDMEMFASLLYKEGYFTKANFLRRGKLDFSCFDGHYGREFIKFAAVKFGEDHQAIAKWLSGSELKKVAVFGCPSLSRKSVFSAKRLRRYFEIQEDMVCKRCILKHSCQFVNQRVWKDDTKTLNLAVAMRVITEYALEAVHPKLSVPSEIKASVSRLLTEVSKLSRTC